MSTAKISAAPVRDPGVYAGTGIFVRSWQVWFLQVYAALSELTGGPVHYGALADIPGNLTAADADYLYCASDFNHLYRWTGTGWTWGPGDSGSGMRAVCDADPGAGWHICDGSTVARAKADGTTETITLPKIAETYARL